MEMLEERIKELENRSVESSNLNNSKEKLEKVNKTAVPQGHMGYCQMSLDILGSTTDVIGHF